VKLKFKRKELDGLRCYGVYHDDILVGYVHKSSSGAWGALQYERGVEANSEEFFLYDSDTREQAARSLVKRQGS
jgi:hypothetical protein